MEAKSIDNLLNELNNVQLSKESMSGITGGWSVEFQTATGKLYMRYSERTGKLMECRLDGRWRWADEIAGGPDSHA